MKIKISILFFLVSITSSAQCAMCKAVVESGDADMAQGLNDGIMYLMIFPYLLVGALLYFIYKYKFKSKN